MGVRAEEGRLTTATARVLVTTAVPAERDAVARGLPGAGEPVTLPGVTLLRIAETSPGGVGYDLSAVGVGPARAAAGTAAALTAAAVGDRPYDLVVSAGIAGGLAGRAPIGGLVVADEITAADLGAETADGFLPVTELGFGAVAHRPPAELTRACAAATGAAAGTVLTASTVTGTASRADLLRARHPRALAEAMEGFGVAEAAAAHGVPVMELRAISNAVGPRDRAAWRVEEALATLAAAFEKLAPVLETWNHDAL
ncbi:futalosine hydrolase [Streptomyces sp. HSG2]|uniref:futalosine hydrolase n=1 Tax=Streptomyces sp. HSG2 TaxID=2797167 RepID=UPI001F5B9433|nr:futalosine hydrolase [Streptomyces sp. HSG2]